MTMNKRYLLAAVLVTIGLLTMIGAVGSLECGNIGIGETFARAGAGFAMIVAAAPVSGDLKKRVRTMIQIKCGTVKMEGRIDIICGECGALVMSVAEQLAATQKISLREATETLITAIYKSIPEWEKENRP